ncbi:hypothetical protein BCR35DRAFT_303752 [Leucosporidium creatinivorum]|uniref:FAD synthase n=1 Tax=Leucosporidium creatinivorum TaxID=106004 RepID=A0A1Y2FEK2_9BASI|nr:hypothetical protein BCR35DRAFT_303752 [Leucosporidium creatinivorum]
MTGHLHQEPSHRGHFSLADAAAVYKLAEEPTPLGEKVKDALSIIDKAIADFGLDQVALSFNGGKDCTVLVHLMAASAYRHLAPSLSSTSASSPPPPQLNSIYIRCPSPFPQVEAFVTVCAARYHLELEAVEGTMKDALQVYLDKRKKEERIVKAVLVGTRRGDPHGANLTPFVPTDAGWPAFMRVHPILDWTYDEIWDFLRHTNLSLGDGTIEWCELYDYGYTSLGSTHNTFPNPLLRATDDPSVLGGWRPAWELQDPSQERAGREVKVNDVLTKSGKEPAVWNGEAQN